MIYYPVLIPTLNRYQHFKECVESLAKCTHADKTELVIGLDYPPSEKYVEGWKKIKEFIPSISGFNKVTVFEHTHNLGSIGNWKALQSYSAEHYDAWINTEDDNVFSPCFLDYMNKCLEKYKDDNSILAVSGYMDPIAWNTTTESTVIKTQDYAAWGIGKWKRTNEELDQYMPEHYMHYVCTHRKKLWKMRNNLRDLYQLIFWTKNNPALDIRCDFTIACYMIINKKYCINPLLSLVRNMGYDGSGEHCGTIEDDFYSRQMISEKNEFNLNDNASNKNYSECIKQFNETKKSTNFFYAENLKLVRKYFWMYLIFGYRFSEVLLKLKTPFEYYNEKIKKFLKLPLRPIYHFFKRVIINK